MITVLSHGKKIRAKKKDNLADKLHQAGISLNLYCNKRGLCGKCFVEITKGEKPPPSPREQSWLKERGLGESYRLACQYEIGGDLEVIVPVSSAHPEVPILPSIMRWAVRPDPAVKKYYLELLRPDLARPDSLFELIIQALGARHLKIPLDLLKDLGGILEKGDFRVTVSVYREKEVIDVEPGNTQGRNFGLAIDVGTTTLVMELVNCDTGQTLDMEAALNSQVKHGADVISRISHALAGPKNAAELRELVLATLNQMIRRLLVRNRVSPASAYEVVISGNTTMNHLLLGVPIRSLAAAPYHASFSRLPVLEAQEAGLAVHPRAKTYFAPNIRSFIGGDIASGLLASRLASRRGNFLFIDLGTNGEIVLKADHELLAASTAAGPAFEGMNISCGMPALPGAIYEVEDDGTFRVFTVAGTAARGICGTGLIDVIAIALRRGDIAAGGAIRTAEKKIPVSETIALTQEDVRQMQLAAAAVKTGIRMMLKGAGLSVSDLNGIYIAGAFGSYLNIRNSMEIGLLPGLEQRKVRFIGNSSLAGARLLLLAKQEREKVESLARKVRYISLASDPEFQNTFISALEFRSWA
ncbi:MAG: ASKHA domain-containing protein [Acidobacteriota bacterium]